MSRRIVLVIARDIPDGTPDEEVLSLLRDAGVQVEDPSDDVEVEGGITSAAAFADGEPVTGDGFPGVPATVLEDLYEVMAGKWAAP